MKKTPDIYEGQSDTLRIALCQVLTREWDVEGNLERCLDSLDEAGRQEASLAVLPECVFHGYGGGTTPELRARLQAVAEPVDGPSVSAVCEKARSLHMAVLVGFAERAESGAVHNSAVFVSAEGNVEDVYRKVHCRDFESVEHRGAFTPGDSFRTYPVRSHGRTFTAGTMICFDREIPESVRCLRSLGAHLVLCPLACDTVSFAQPIDCAHNEMITTCRAIENEVFIVVVNHAGRFNGGSYVVGPGGEVLHQMGSEPGVAVVDVPVGCIPASFHSRPLERV